MVDTIPADTVSIFSIPVGVKNPLTFIHILYEFLSGSGGWVWGAGLPGFGL
jgi:hypothetical protein